jgi:hypothetical protein
MSGDSITTNEHSSTLDELKRVFRYDSHTGYFYWRIRAGRGGDSKYPGDIAGTLRKDGYIRIGFAGRVYLAHRLAWNFMTGDWPPRSLDVEHRNADKADNRWANLFAVPRMKNKQNLNDDLRKDNHSGCRGVSLRPEEGKWYACIIVDGRTIWLGRYTDFEQAVAARKAAERRYFGPGHSEALTLKLRSVLGDSYVLRQIPVVRPIGISSIGQ